MDYYRIIHRPGYRREDLDEEDRQTLEPLDDLAARYNVRCSRCSVGMRYSRRLTISRKPWIIEGGDRNETDI